MENNKKTKLDKYVNRVRTQERQIKKMLNIDEKTLKNQTWIVRESGSGTREATEKLFRQLNISPKKLMHYSSIQPIKESVEGGMGISLLSKWAVQKELKYGDLTV